MTGRHRDGSRLLIPLQISSFVFTPEDRPDAVMQCVSPRSGYSPILADTARDAPHSSAGAEASLTRALLASGRIRHLSSSVFDVIGVDAQKG
jgi:hypothetical protein